MKRGRDLSDGSNQHSPSFSAVDSLALDPVVVVPPPSPRQKQGVGDSNVLDEIGSEGRGVLPGRAQAAGKGHHR